MNAQGIEFHRLADRIRRHVSNFQWNTQSVSLVLVALAVLFSVALISNRTSVTRDSLFSGRRLSASDTQRVQLALAKSGLSDYVVEHGELLVPREHKAAYLTAIEQARALPHTFYGPMQVALDAGSVLEGTRKANQRIEHAAAEGASVLIRELRGIEEAFVYFDELAERVGLQRQHEMTAVAVVRLDNDQLLDLQYCRSIQDILLSFKAGLSVDNITISDANSGRSYRGRLDAADSPHMVELLTRSLEKKWKEKLTNVLAVVPDAQVSLRIATDAKIEAAKSVVATIEVPTPVSDEPIASAENDALTNRIRSRVLPLLPGGAQNPENSVSVDYVEVPSKNRPVSNTSFAAWWPVGLALGTVALLIATTLLFQWPDPDPKPVDDAALRVYRDEVRPDSQDPMSTDADDQAAKLRAYVEEDPESAAKSLSEFIDRAS